MGLIETLPLLSFNITQDFLRISDFFKKRSLFWSENFKNFVYGFLTLYAFIISKVIIRPQNYTDASLISAYVVISYQNVRGA